MAFSDNLRAFRKNELMTQEELGKAMNVSQKTISSWEVGRTEPTMGEIVQLCKIFDCTVEDLTDTRSRNIGEVGVEDIIVKICTTNDTKVLNDIKNVLNQRLDFLMEMEKAPRANKHLVKYYNGLKRKNFKK